MSNPSTQNQYKKAISLSTSFLKSSLKDRDVIAIEQLRVKVSKKLDVLKAGQPGVIRRDLKGVPHANIDKSLISLFRRGIIDRKKKSSIRIIKELIQSINLSIH